MTMWKWTHKINHVQTHSDDGLTEEDEKEELIKYLKQTFLFLALQPIDDIERYISLEVDGEKGWEE